MRADDIAAIIAWPHSNICSDGALVSRHPRSTGAFTKVLRVYVREQKLLGFEEAIRRMTSLGAAHVGIRDRGTIRAGRLRRSRAARSGDGGRSFDDAGPDGALGRHPERLGERPDRVPRRQGDRRHAGPRPEARECDAARGDRRGLPLAQVAGRAGVLARWAADRLRRGRPHPRRRGRRRRGAGRHIQGQRVLEPLLVEGRPEPVLPVGSFRQQPALETRA